MRATPFLTTILLACCGIAYATDVGVVGLFPGKAVLVVDGGSPKTYSVGAPPLNGVKLISASGSSAVIEVNGKRQTVSLGEQIASHVAPATSASITLHAIAGGHFIAHAQINGSSEDLLVDTGATMIALPASDAARLNVRNYKSGEVSYVNTANGVVPVYHVVLNTIKVGDIELNQVEAVVQEGGLPFALLGMSFLNRMEMRREGEQMVLTKRY